MRFPRHVLDGRDPSARSRNSVSTVNRVASGDVDAVLGCVRRCVWLRFRDRGTEMIFADVLTTPRMGQCSVIPWGCVGLVYTFAVRDLRALGVPLGFSHARFSEVCREQRRMAAQGRFT